MIKWLQKYAPHSLDATHLVQAINRISNNETGPLTCLPLPHPGADPESGPLSSSFERLLVLKKTFFKFMKHAWTSLDLTSFSPPQISAFYHRPILHLQLLEARGDYNEFLELAKFFLVEKLTRRRESSRQSNFLMLTVMLGGCIKLSTPWSWRCCYASSLSSHGTERRS